MVSPPCSPPSLSPCPCPCPCRFSSGADLHTTKKLLHSLSKLLVRAYGPGGGGVLLEGPPLVLTKEGASILGHFDLRDYGTRAHFL